MQGLENMLKISVLKVNKKVNFKIVDAGKRNSYFFCPSIVNLRFFIVKIAVRL